MAETTGVTNSPPSGNATPPGGPRAGANKKRQRLLLYGGIAAGGFLLLSHRGGSASANQTDPNAQLQNQSDALAAEEAAMLNPPIPGGGAPVDTGGGSYTTQGPSTTNAPGPVNVTVNVPGAGKPPGKPPKRKPPGHKPPAHHKPPKPKMAHRNRPNPATHAGKGADSQGKTKRGNRRGSPAEVESIRGIGAGQMVMGREFPGAIAHRMGAPHVNTDGTMTRSVTVDYGGRAETHLVHNNGERWTDNAPGANPPSRGIPIVNNGVPM